MTCLIRLGVTLLVQIHIQLLPDSEALLHLIISSSRRLCLCFHHHILPFPPIFFSDRSAQAIYFFFSFVLFKKILTSPFALLRSTPSIPELLSGRENDFQAKRSISDKGSAEHPFPFAETASPAASLFCACVIHMHVWRAAEEMVGWRSDVSDTETGRDP